MGQKTGKLFERAQTNFHQENHENALRLFNQVLNREPSHKKALRSKALIKIYQENFEEAEKFLLLAIERQPEDDQLYQMLGSLYHNNNKPQKAVAQFQKAVQFNSKNSMAHSGLGILFGQVIGNHKKAIDHFTQALSVTDDDADLFFNRGCSYLIEKKMDKAQKDLCRADELGHKQAKELVEKYFI